MKSLIVVILRLFILSALIVSSAFTLPGGQGIYGALAIALILLVVGISAGFRAGAVFGFFMVFAPLFGRGSFHLSWASFLLGQLIGELFDSVPLKEEQNRAKDLLLLSLLCFISIFLLGVVVPFRISFDPWTAYDVLRNGGVVGFRQYWAVTNSIPSRALTTLSGYLLIFFHVQSLVNSEKLASDIKRIVKGLCIGLFCSMGFLISQSLGSKGLLAANYTDYWRLLRQYPAASTDPNALAILCVLLLPLVMVAFSRGRSQLLIILSLLTLGLATGSRTFFLALFIGGAILTFLKIRRFGRWELNAAVGASFVAVLASLILLGHPQVNSQLQARIPMTGAVRVLKSIHWEERASMFASRAIFSKVAVNVWQQSPIVGVGLERFFDLEKAAMAQLGIDLGGFVDNANNFYLQLLSETGLLGVSIFVISLSLLGFIVMSPSLEEEIEIPAPSIQRHLIRRIEHPDLILQSAARVTLFLFLILLLTGSHLLSPEVQLGVAVLLTAAFSRPVLVRRIVMKQVHLAVSLTLFIFTLGNLVFSAQIFQAPRSRGFYYPDSHGEPLVRWSGSDARVVVCNNQADTVTLRFRSLKPGSERKPILVMLHEGEVDKGDTTQNFELINNEWTTAIVNLRPDEHGKFPNAVVSLKVGPLWSPAQMKVGSDPRWLGVLVELPKGSC